MSEPKLNGYWQYCGLNLLMLSRIWETQLERQLSELNITLRELLILRLIAASPETKVKDIRLYLGESEGSIATRCSVLKKKYMLNDVAVCSEQRTKKTTLTPKGEAILKLADRVLQSEEQAFLGHLPRATRRGVNMTIENVLERKLT